MNIAFTLDALSDSGKHAWRLLEDGKTWRKTVFAADVVLGDALITDDKILRPQIGRRLVKSRHTGLTSKEKLGIFNFMQRGIFSHAILHRFSAAPIPDPQQMIDTLRQMKPDTAQLLYLDLGGAFRSRDATDLVDNPAIAVRGEIASSAQFIGEQAAANHAYTDNLWQQFIAGWWQHLANRRINGFIPDLERCPTVEKALTAIQQFEPEATP
ncbi:MAG: hypothetical protein R8J84_08690 [Mariprofundales bacterium]